MADDIFAVLRGIVMRGIDLLDATDVYAWGLDREFAALRAACAPGLRGMNSGERSAPDAAGRSDVIGGLSKVGAARKSA
jgi:hypothetical protein